MAELLKHQCVTGALVHAWLYDEMGFPLGMVLMSDELRLNEDAIEAWGIALKREPLARLRLKARRCGAWFSRLKSDERRYVELVIKVVDRVRSPLVVKLLAPLIKRLLDAMGGIEALEGKVAHRMKTVGRSLAQKISLIAQGWGNKSAVRWVDDHGFIRYLTIMDMNLSSMFKV